MGRGPRLLITRRSTDPGRADERGAVIDAVNALVEEASALSWAAVAGHGFPGAISERERLVTWS